MFGEELVEEDYDDVEKEKREFMIYESTFSDILGIIGFYGVLAMADSNSNESLSVGVFSNFFLTVIFSVIIS
mgnify:CR=1 FL=1